MYTTLRDAENLGISKRDVRKILEERLTKSDTRLLMKGQFKTPSYSEERFKTLIKRLEVENPEAALNFEDNIDVLKDIFDDIRKDTYQYDLEESKNSLENLIDEILTPEVPEIRSLPMKAPTRDTSAPQATLQTPNLTQGTTAAVQNQQANFNQRFLNIGQDPRYKVAFPNDTFLT